MPSDLVRPNHRESVVVRPGRKRFQRELPYGPVGEEAFRNLDELRRNADRTQKMVALTSTAPAGLSRATSERLAICKMIQAAAVQRASCATRDNLVAVLPCDDSFRLK